MAQISGRLLLVAEAEVKLALWQSEPTNGRIETVFPSLCTQLQAVAKAGAKLLILPELFLPGYNRPDLHASSAQPIDGEWMGRLRDMAADAGCGLCLGWAERDGDRVYNAATTIGPDGRILGHYRKIQLYGPREKALYAAGDAYATFALGQVTVALLICYDAEFAPHIAALRWRGVGLLCVPTANMMPFTHVSRATIPANAANGAMTIVYANFCGAEGDLAYAGHSVIAGPHGEVVAAAGDGPALLIAEIPQPDPARLYDPGADYRKVT